jgi:chromosome segregation ATPase
MSKSIATIFIILIIIIAGFAYLNYNRLNQIQSDLLQKEALLKVSDKLIKEQESTLVQLEEKVKEVLEKEELPPEEYITVEKEDELLKQLDKYQEELLALQSKMEVVLQKSKSDTEDLALLREEKSKLEALLTEREVQWQEKEEGNRRIINSLQQEIQQYETEIELIGNKVSNIEQNLESEKLKRKELEQNMVKHEETISNLRRQLTVNQDDETYVQQISQLELNKKQLEEKIAQKDSNLLQFQQEYQELQNQLTAYEQQIEKLQEEIVQALEQKEMLSYIKDNLAQMEMEKSKLEKILQEKETQWLEGEQIHKDTIALFQEEITKYESNIKEIGKEVLVLREDLIKEKSLQEPIQKEKEALEKILVEKQEEWKKQNEENRKLISYLKEQLEKYKEEIDLIKFDSDLFKEEIATQLEFQQQSLSQIREREDQIALLTSQIEQYMHKIEDYEKNVAEISIKLQQQEDISYQEQQNLMETIRSLVKERDEYQNNINQCHTQVSRLQLEIAELKYKIGLLEKKQEPKYYEVKSGDCLWTIARNKYNEGVAWIKIFKANQGQIENPDLIYPYQQFILPD